MYNYRKKYSGLILAPDTNETVNKHKPAYI